MSRRLIVLVGLLACSHLAPTEETVQGNDITNPSPSTWAEKLPDTKGKASGGAPDYPFGDKTSDFELGDHGMSVTGAIWIQLTEQYSGNKGLANLEISVEQGKVRLYFADPEKRYRYIEATPGQPARIFGRMIGFMQHWGIELEAVDGDASGVKWHAWNKSRR